MTGHRVADKVSERTTKADCVENHQNRAASGRDLKDKGWLDAFRLRRKNLTSSGRLVDCHRNKTRSVIYPSEARRWMSEVSGGGGGVERSGGAYAKPITSVLVHVVTPK
ncbi:hypothetical protein EYF80_035190 [Liparis tanakae]|uniref:Uncharacterized protein n=1 Tax=Liparis tanakae TaxID=230148 RepID=A0A4Z2GLY8_9TELE|nr:hypothetical protein EYF80_035190 [Liparis tanakae]